MRSCPCCHSKQIQDEGLPGYFLCAQCGLCFLDPEQRLNPEAERARYLEHDNRPDHEGYIRFLQPVVSECLRAKGPPATLLDYGAGPAPVLSDWLKREGYTVTSYDPVFPRDDIPVDTKFDLIVACEVAEHFFDPYAEFTKLRQLLAPDGRLILSTYFYPPTKISFKGWHYRQDPTHVVFYSPTTLNWIAKHLKFGAPEIIGSRLAVLPAN